MRIILSVFISLFFYNFVLSQDLICGPYCPGQTIEIPFSCSSTNGNVQGVVNSIDATYDGTTITLTIPEDIPTDTYDFMATCECTDLLGCEEDYIIQVQISDGLAMDCGMRSIPRDATYIIGGNQGDCSHIFCEGDQVRLSIEAAADYEPGSAVWDFTPVNTLQSDRIAVVCAPCTSADAGAYSVTFNDINGCEHTLDYELIYKDIIAEAECPPE